MSKKHNKKNRGQNHGSHNGKSFGSSSGLQLDLGSFLSDSGPDEDPKEKPLSASMSPIKTGSCHESHNPFTIGAGTIIGANCSRPRSGYDIYVGLDHTMADMRGWPWEEGKENIIDVHFPIRDMSIPKGPDVETFKKMVTWLCNQLQAGKKVHVGCIGGHGRTGLVLSAIVAEALGMEDAITHVRSVHCKKAVESAEQIDFLHDHYGVKKVEATKGFTSGWGKSSSPWGSKSSTGHYDSKSSNVSQMPKSPNAHASSASSYGGKAKAYRPFKGNRTVWSPTP